MHDMKRRIVLVTELIITGHRRLFNLIVHQCLCKGDSGWNLKVKPPLSTGTIHWHQVSMCTSAPLFYTISQLNWD